jgi:hypothetical protein
VSSRRVAQQCHLLVGDGRVVDVSEDAGAPGTALEALGRVDESTTAVDAEVRFAARVDRCAGGLTGGAVIAMRVIGSLFSRIGTSPTTATSASTSTSMCRRIPTCMHTKGAAMTGQEQFSASHPHIPVGGASLSEPAS